MAGAHRADDGKNTHSGIFRELLNERENLLRTAGYEVVVAPSFTAAVQIIENDFFDLAVMGFSVPEEERNQLARVFKQSNPRAKIIMIYSNSVQNSELADALMQTTVSAKDILQAVNYLLHKDGGEQSRAC
jgi:DNA-binding NtrC family response regulator